VFGKVKVTGEQPRINQFSLIQDQLSSCVGTRFAFLRTGHLVPILARIHSGNDLNHLKGDVNPPTQMTVSIMPPLPIQPRALRDAIPLQENENVL
jgi:hypothetical protein